MQIYYTGENQDTANAQATFLSFNLFYVSVPISVLSSNEITKENSRHHLFSTYAKVSKKFALTP